MTELQDRRSANAFRRSTAPLVARACMAAGLFFVAVWAPALALGAPASAVVVSDAWVRATAPGQPVAAAYMSIMSSRDGTLEHVAADSAGEVQVHSMWMEGDVMRMRQLRQLPLPAAHKVRLAPAGTHLMLLDLKRPLRAGETVRFTLTVLDASGHRQLVHTAAPVRAEAPEAAR